MNSTSHNLSQDLCFALVVISISMVFAGCGRSAVKVAAEAQPVPYTVLYDEMTANIDVGVEPGITEDQLRATLIKIANDRQGDAARDYMMADHLLVQAYLVLPGKKSSVPAARLGRYVPPKNPQAQDEYSMRKREDSFLVTLEEAKRSLQ